MNIQPNLTAEGLEAQKPAQPTTTQSKLAEEIQKMEVEPLLPIEKKLISYSLILGVVLLGILIFISYHYFPGQ